MAKIFVKTNYLVNHTYLISENDKKKIKTTKENGYLVIPSEIYENKGIQVASSFNKKETNIIYPGDFSLSFINDKDNTKIKYDLSDGQVINHMLKDKKNLSYLETPEKEIYVYLPKEYNKTKPCEVLLCFDGQNDFSSLYNYTTRFDPYGGVQIDALISSFIKETGRNIIVVGIDNSSPLREVELTMDRRKFGKLNPRLKKNVKIASEGKLDALDRFINETLLPFIKKEYNADLSSLYLYGSSCGGLASTYIGLKHLGQYKGILAFSPAYALFNFEGFERFVSNIDLSSNKLPRIFFYCGQGDELEKLLIGDSKKFETLLLTRGYDHKLISSLYVPSFPHNEVSWRMAFPQGLSFVLKDSCK